MIEGKKEVLHKNMFWSEGGGSGEWAVRSGEKLFHVEPSPKEAGMLERINLTMSKMLSDINAESRPDTKSLAEKNNLQKEDLDNILSALPGTPASVIL